MDCPKCSKQMLDVRGVKSNPKAPDFQCPDANCLNDKGYRTGAWLPKGNIAAAVRPYAQPTHPGPGYVPRAIVDPGASQAHGGPPENGRDAHIVTLYMDSFDRVLQKVKQEKLVDLFHGDSFAAMIATLFIARSKGS